MTASQKLNKYWRVLATGISFVFFGMGGVVLTFIIFPVLTLCIKNKTRRELKARKIIQQSFALFCGTMRFLGAIEYRFVGDKSFQEDENCIILANHPSLIDYVLIVSRLPQCVCLVKKSIWHNFFMKGVVQAAGYIQQQNGQSLIEDCDAWLKAGNVILIFPEGTRTTLGEISKLHRGAAQIAIKTKTDFRLLHISVNPPILTKQKKWYHVSDKKPLFEIKIKSKVRISDFIESGTLPSISVRNLSKYLEEHLFLSEIH
ncbi:MAG: 1-acyl-sn-glycerol-3-phosphate acyltransferase [Psychromonas sp.]|nr:1-acyl-sn-glycerol-3-phosphate acyltransferase [Psychromonas sp.]